MTEYVGFDVSKEETAFCVKDVAGKILARGKVATDPGALFAALREHCLCPGRIVLVVRFRRFEPSPPRGEGGARSAPGEGVAARRRPKDSLWHAGAHPLTPTLSLRGCTDRRHS